MQADIIFSLVLLSSVFPANYIHINMYVYAGVAAPSANASGRPSPTEALHVLQVFA